MKQRTVVREGSCVSSRDDTVSGPDNCLLSSLHINSMKNSKNIN